MFEMNKMKESAEYSNELEMKITEVVDRVN